AIARMVGQKQAGQFGDLGHNISTSEAMQIERGDLGLLQMVQERECQDVDRRLQPACYANVEMQVRTLAQDLGHESDQTITPLRPRLGGLGGVEGAKTLVFISEGFVITDSSLIIALGSLAAAARTSLYVLRLDTSWFDVTLSRAPRDPIGDRRVQLEGLEL